MKWDRPPGYDTRQVGGYAFGESAVLIREASGSRNEYGEWIAGAASEREIEVGSEPPFKEDFSRHRITEEGGLRLHDMRNFFIGEALHPAGRDTIGDILRYDGERYRVMSIQAWGSHWEAIAERIEPQASGSGVPSEMMPLVVQRALRAFVATGSGLPRENVIPGNDNGRRPLEPYASVLVVSDRLDGEALEKYRQMPGQAPDDPPDTIIDSVTNHRAEVSIRFFRSATDARQGAHNSARNFLNWLDTETGKQAADRAGFRLEGMFESLRSDEVISDHWEERAGVDMTVLYRYREPASQDVGTMDRARIVIRGPAQSQTETIDGA